MKEAVCILIETPNDKFIAVSRRNSETRWGLPGGKVDSGESNVEAIIRETLEEIGLEVDPAQLTPLYSDLCPGAVTYWVTTYLYKHPYDPENLKAEEGLLIKALTLDELCDSVVSPFANYNKDVFIAWAKYVVQNFRESDQVRNLLRSS
jgi:8-oxo-dGTP pyrophosphatase MutT (NUDIX family)